MKSNTGKKVSGFSRREFIKTSAAVGVATVLSNNSHIFASGSDKLRVGLIGCGERGREAAWNCVTSAENVELYAMADMFGDQIINSTNWLNEKVADKVNVPVERQFLGFDAYKKLLATDIDVVILATPPGFRPEHLRAAVEAGKHVFVEKPGAVDPVGVRSLIESGKMAEAAGLSIVVGTQQRRMPQYIEVMKRIHGGEAGEIVGGQASWLWGWQDWHFAQRKAEWSDMEWQLRCWPYFTWLSGDHIVEQHMHNMDIMNWAIGSHPIKCTGMGGRQSRTGPEYGNIYDHFAVEYEYPGGICVTSMARQVKGAAEEISERIVCTKGRSYTTRALGYIKGKYNYKFEGETGNAFVEEHADLIKSIRANKPINEVQHLAESTLTVIMGRMSAYTGRALSWDWVLKSSRLDLSPAKYELGDLEVRPIAVPGVTELV